MITLTTTPLLWALIRISISFQLEIVNTHTLRLFDADLRMLESSSSAPVLLEVLVSGKNSTLAACWAISIVRLVLRLSLKYK